MARVQTLGPVLLAGSVCIRLLRWGLRPDHTEGPEDQRLLRAQESHPVSETSNLWILLLRRTLPLNSAKILSSISL